MIDWLLKVFVGTIIEAIGAVIALPFSRARRLERLQQRGEEHDRRLSETRTYHDVKVRMHKGGAQRVRIVRDGENFGAVLDTRNSTAQEWKPTRILGAGTVYDSAEAAEALAQDSVPWLKAQNE